MADLSKMSDEDMIAELKKRNYRIEKIRKDSMTDAQRKWAGKKIIELLKIYIAGEFKTEREERDDVWCQVGDFINANYELSKKNEGVKNALCMTAAFLDYIERYLYI